MARGDHIRVRRGLYWHHGIDCGDGTVIHYDGSPRRRDGRVGVMSLEHFTRGHRLEVVSVCQPNRADEIVQRAESRMGEASYDLVSNNCEHFATWCVSGRSQSRQVRRVINALATGVAVGWVAFSLLRRGKGPTRA